MPPTPSRKVVPIRRSIALMDEAELVDFYGEKQRLVDLFQPTADEHAVAKKRLVEMGESQNAEAALSFTGRDYVVQLGARKNERTVIKQALAYKLIEKALGKAGAIGAITIPLGLIDKCITETQQKLFVVKEQTGSRSVDVVALFAPAA
jgi:hypothetical protein